MRLSARSGFPRASLFPAANFPPGPRPLDSVGDGDVISHFATPPATPAAKHQAFTGDAHQGNLIRYRIQGPIGLIFCPTCRWCGSSANRKKCTVPRRVGGRLPTSRWSASAPLATLSDAHVGRIMRYRSSTSRRQRTAWNSVSHDRRKEVLTISTGTLANGANIASSLVSVRMASRNRENKSTPRIHSTGTWYLPMAILPSTRANGLYRCRNCRTTRYRGPPCRSRTCDRRNRGGPIPRPAGHRRSPGSCRVSPAYRGPSRLSSRRSWWAVPLHQGLRLPRLLRGFFEREPSRIGYPSLGEVEYPIEYVGQLRTFPSWLRAVVSSGCRWPGPILCEFRA